MTRFGEIVYQVVALLAMLAHLLIVGPLSLIALALTVPPGAELGGLVLKAMVGIVWLGMGYLGIRAWRRNSWLVIVAPIVAFILVYVLILTGNDVVGWYLNIGY